MSKVNRYSNGNARRKLRARIKAQGLPCALCGKAIDYSLPAGHPYSFELDEIVPVSLGGSPIDSSNVQPAHRVCNQIKSNCIVAKHDKRKDKSQGSESKATQLQNKTNAISKW